MEQEYTALRCPNHREHGTYDLCGRLLGALHEKKIFVYCEVCKQFFEVNIGSNDHVEMRPLSKETRLKLKTRLRVINND